MIEHREVVKQTLEVEARFMERHVNMHRRRPKCTRFSHSDRIQRRAGKSSRCVEKLCTSSRSRPRSLSERAGAKTVRRKDLTTREASTWCADRKCKGSTRHAYRSVKRACLRRETRTDHDAHCRSSGGCRRAGVLISARRASVGDVLRQDT